MSGKPSFGPEITSDRKFNHEFTPEQRAAIMVELRAGKRQVDLQPTLVPTNASSHEQRNGGSNTTSFPQGHERGVHRNLRPYRLYVSIHILIDTARSHGMTSC
ncbi:Hat family dimerization protein [Fusarium oxysporum f. sp. albedinis]|nr:Hat family dimerization protein [Fusarium oxysporum f. sp. albedinis]